MIVDVVLGSMRRLHTRIEREALARAKYDGRGVSLGGRRAELEALVAMSTREPSLGHIFEAHCNAALLVALFGTEAQRRQAHADAHAGELFALWHEPNEAGVRLERRRSTYVLRGSVMRASGADTVTRALIVAHRPEGGLQLCLVPLDRCFVTIDDSGWQPLGLGASNSYHVCFDEIELSDEDLVGAPGDFERDPWLLGGTLRRGAVLTGAIERLTRETLAFLVARGLDHDPYVRVRAGELRVAARSARNWLRAGEDAWQDFDAAPSERTAESVVDMAGMARVAIERAGRDAIELATRCIGAPGLVRPLPFAQLIADLHMLIGEPGTDAALASSGEIGMRLGTTLHSVTMSDSLRSVH
jgi:alkylation response protein AidB-like acyl-CoA dehydrogenase